MVSPSSTSDAAPDSVDVTAGLEHQRDAPLDHCFDRRLALEDRAAIWKLRPAVRHLVGKKKVKTLVDADRRRGARQLVLRQWLPPGIPLYPIPSTVTDAEQRRRLSVRKPPLLGKRLEGFQGHIGQALSIVRVSEGLHVHWCQGRSSRAVSQLSHLRSPFFGQGAYVSQMVRCQAPNDAIWLLG